MTVPTCVHLEPVLTCSVYWVDPRAIPFPRYAPLCKVVLRKPFRICTGPVFKQSRRQCGRARRPRRSRSSLGPLIHIVYPECHFQYCRRFVKCMTSTSISMGLDTDYPSVEGFSPTFPSSLEKQPSSWRSSQIFTGTPSVEPDPSSLSDRSTTQQENSSKDDKEKQQDDSILPSSNALGVDIALPESSLPSMTRTREAAFIIITCISQFLSLSALNQTVAPVLVLADYFHVEDYGTLSWFSASFSMSVGTFILPAGMFPDTATQMNCPKCVALQWEEALCFVALSLCYYPPAPFRVNTEKTQAGWETCTATSACTSSGGSGSAPCR
jgi:hypothetical protein